MSDSGAETLSPSSRQNIRAQQESDPEEDLHPLSSFSDVETMGTTAREVEHRGQAHTGRGVGDRAAPAPPALNVPIDCTSEWALHKPQPRKGNCGAGEDLRVPWTARRSNQSILKEVSPEYSLEGLMLKLKLQYFGHLMRGTN